MVEEPYRLIYLPALSEPVCCSPYLNPPKCQEQKRVHTHTHTRKPTTPQFPEPQEHDATRSAWGIWVPLKSSSSSSLFCKGSQQIALPEETQL